MATLFSGAWNNAIQFTNDQSFTSTPNSYFFNPSAFPSYNVFVSGVGNGTNISGTGFSVRNYQDISGGVQFDVFIPSSVPSGAGIFWYSAANSTGEQFSRSGFDSIVAFAITSMSLNGLIPTMTGNSAPSGVASASTEYSGTYAAWKAFDGQAIPPASDSWITTDTITSGWLEYQFTGPQIVTVYEIVPWAYDLYPTMAPRDWIFQGSDDNSTWTNLDTHSGVTTGWAVNTSRYFYFTNSHAYTYYRLNVSANNGFEYLRIAKLQMYATLPSNYATNPNVVYGENTPIKIYAANGGLAGTSAIDFNGTAAASFTVVSDTVVTAVSPSSFTSGLMTLTSSPGTLTTWFNVDAPHLVTSSMGWNSTNGYEWHQFLTNTNITTTSALLLDAFLVGGGGGGHPEGSGGGGGTNYTHGIVLPAGTYPIIVGVGGPNSYNNKGFGSGGGNNIGAYGTLSLFNGLIAKGGQGGASQPQPVHSPGGNQDGYWGGASGNGYEGDWGYGNYGGGGSGGGGAGGAAPVKTNQGGGEGGAALANSITGPTIYYGGGGAYSSPGVGGGTGSGNSALQCNGVDGRGGGGGCNNNGSGGDGVVILAIISALPDPVTNVYGKSGDTQAIIYGTPNGASDPVNIYQGSTPGGESGTAAATSVSLPYTINGLTNGTPYYFTVKSNHSGALSLASNEVSLTPESLAGGGIIPIALNGGFQS